MKRGTVREDGRIFWGHRGPKIQKKEIWLTPESFVMMQAQLSNRQKQKLQDYRDAQNKLPPEERNYKGKFIPETGLYFAYVNSGGKPIYKTKEEYDIWANGLRKIKTNYHRRCKNLPLPTVVLGDRHPTDPNLYVKNIYGNKVFYGTLEEVNETKALRCKRYQRYHSKNKKSRKESYKKIRQERFKVIDASPQGRRKKGEIDVILGKIFWGYSYLAKEIWMTKEVFDRNQQITQERRRKRYLKQKQ